MKNRKVCVGADPFPPYQYYDEAGCLQGSDFETVKDTFERAGFTAEVQLGPWDEIEAAVARGELDAVFQVQKTPQREAAYCFSDLLRNAVTEVITGDVNLADGSGLHSALHSWAEAETRGLTVGVIKNYAYGEDVDRLRPEMKAAYDSQEALLHAIGAREVDLGIFDRGVRQYLQARLDVGEIYPIESLTFMRPLYVMFREEEMKNAFCEAMHTQVKV